MALIADIESNGLLDTINRIRDYDERHTFK